MKNNEPGPEESDALSHSSSINLDDIPEHGLVRKYRAPDIKKKKEMIKDMGPDEIAEMNNSIKQKKQ